MQEGQTNPTSDNSEEFLAIDRFWTPLDASSSFALTCDVEDYFQVSAFEDHSPRSGWKDRECRIPRNIDRILQLYSDAGVTGTFFILGWVAQHYPGVVRQISESGNEVSSHGMAHVRVWRQSHDEFREDVASSKALLEDLTGQKVRGYRAASWSLDSRTPWAHDALAAAGFEYSSSIYPISHDHYGLPNAPSRPFYLKRSGLLEIPASTAPILGKNLPAAGGGYFRLLPYSASRWLMRRAARRHSVPTVFYYHPWEIDPGQPRINGVSVRARFRHYVNLARFERRLVRLLSEFCWGRIDSLFLGRMQ